MGWRGRELASDCMCLTTIQRRLDVKLFSVADAIEYRGSVASRKKVERRGPRTCRAWMPL